MEIHLNQKSLIRTKNTAHEKIRLHIFIFNHYSKLIFIEAIFEAIHRIGIPFCWRIIKTILIHKKGSIEILSIFRHISLPTMYKLYSVSLSNRLISIAMKTFDIT